MMSTSTIRHGKAIVNHNATETTKTAPRISRHRQALLSMLGAYPTIVVLLTLINPIIGQAPLFVRAAVLVPLMVGILTYFVMPLLTRTFARWLVVNEPGPRAAATELADQSFTYTKAQVFTKQNEGSKLIRYTTQLLGAVITVIPIGCTLHDATDRLTSANDFLP